MNTDNNSNNPAEGKDDANVSLRSRRRFVSGMGVVVPSVLTAASKSALAGVCHSPSATASINLANSRPDRPAEGQCLGRTPGYWINAEKTHSTDWKALSADGKLFGSIYPGGFPGKTLKEVMGMKGNQDSYQLGAHLSAAWCNWKSKRVPESILSLADLQGMWAGAGRLGVYSPVAGVEWGAEEVVSYLKTTMPV